MTRRKRSAAEVARDADGSCRRTLAESAARGAERDAGDRRIVAIADRPLTIAHVVGRRVWDSRGRPTVEAEVVLSNGARGRAIAPAGASTGRNEAVDLRDGGGAFGGLGVDRAVRNVSTEIAKRSAACRRWISRPSTGASSSSTARRRRRVSAAMPRRRVDGRIARRGGRGGRAPLASSGRRRHAHDSDADDSDLRWRGARGTADRHSGFSVVPIGARRSIGPWS